MLKVVRWVKTSYICLSWSCYIDRGIVSQQVVFLVDSFPMSIQLKKKTFRGECFLNVHILFCNCSLTQFQFQPILVSLVLECLFIYFQFSLTFISFMLLRSSARKLLQHLPLPLVVSSLLLQHSRSPQKEPRFLLSSPDRLLSNWLAVSIPVCPLVICCVTEKL